MSTLALTLYVLMWPVIVAIVLGVISVAYARDWRASRGSGDDLI